MRSRKWGLGGALVVAAAFASGPAVKAGSDSPKTEVKRRVEIIQTMGGAQLGVTLGDTTGDARGAVVKKVEPDTPAAASGFKEGDVITRFDGEAVRSAAQLARLVRETPPGRTVAIEIARGGAKQTLSATLAEGKRRLLTDGHDLPDIPDLVPPMPPDAPAPPMLPNFRFHWDDDGGRSFLFDRAFGRGPRKLGIRYQEIEGQLAQYFKLAGDEGVLVTEVEDDSPAAKAGMKAGDVILKFGERAIEDSSDLRRAVDDAEGGSEVEIQVQREGRTLGLKVKLAGEKEKRHTSGDPT